MSAVASAVGGLVSGVGSIIGSGINSAANKKIASQANDTQIELANTAHQREVEDGAAGLNPILSAGGNGASVPTMHVPQVDYGIQDAMSKGITNYSAAESARQYNPLVEQMRSQKALNDALASKAEAEASSAKAMADNIYLDTMVKGADLDIKESGIPARLFGSRIGSIFQRAVTPHVSSAVDTADRSLRDIIDSIHRNSGKSTAVKRPSSNPIHDFMMKGHEFLYGKD